MRISLIFIALLFFNCTSVLDKNQLTNINGYWAIEKVVLSDGFEKEYKINTMVDFFMLEEMTGYRKKVHPLFDGTYDTSDDAQSFEVKQMGDLFEIHYKNNMSEWVETIKTVNKTSFVLSNEEGVTYYYKRFESLKLNVE